VSLPAKKRFQHVIDVAGQCRRRTGCTGTAKPQFPPHFELGLRSSFKVREMGRAAARACKGSETEPNAPASRLRIRFAWRRPGISGCSAERIHGHGLAIV